MSAELVELAGTNIVSLDQHSTGPSGGRFFQRTEFHLRDLAARRADLEVELHQELAAGLDHGGVLAAALR